jgi:acyl carrier protein
MPIDNAQLYITGSNDRLLPVGVEGEICIGGAGVARGYLNRVELTAQKFVRDPFSNDPLAKMYKTGDIGRWLPDGNIEYLGRKDDQVKIRGYRIEPGEIENLLQQCSVVSQGAIVVNTDNNSNHQLVAYVVPNGKFDRESIISWLREKLPDYMLPTAFIELEHMPLTGNGKIDKKALLHITDAGSFDREHTAPRTQMERELAGIWEELLQVERIGIHDDVFSMGAHSLLVIRAISAVRKRLGIEVAIAHVFDYPTIASLGALLTTAASAAKLPAIVPRVRPRLIPLSFSQERLWIAHQLDGSAQYHIPTVLRIKGRLNVPAVEHALRHIVNRHEVLRTVILEEDGKPYQHVLEKNDWRLLVIDAAAYVEDAAGLRAFIEELAGVPFDLQTDYMLRTHLLRLHAEEHILCVTLHHIASDGWSFDILTKEFEELYAAYTEGRTARLSPLPVQYADYAIWQRENLQGEALNDKLQYWQKTLKGLKPVGLITEHAGSVLHSGRGAVYTFYLEEKLTIALKALGQQQGVTLFMTLLCAIKIVLRRYSGQSDISIGCPVAGRQQQEIEGLIGVFINTLVIRSTIDDELTFHELLQQERQIVLSAYEHQEVPFEKVLEALGMQRQMNSNPLFRVLFEMQNNTGHDLESNRGLANLELQREPVIRNLSKFDLAFSLSENAAGLRCNIEYSTDLHTLKDITLLAERYGRLLTDIVNAPFQKTGDLQILSITEQQRLTAVLNSKTINKNALFDFEQA